MKTIISINHFLQNRGRLLLNCSLLYKLKSDQKSSSENNECRIFLILYSSNLNYYVQRKKSILILMVEAKYRRMNWLINQLILQHALSYHSDTFYIERTTQHLIWQVKKKSIELNGTPYNIFTKDFSKSEHINAYNILIRLKHI